MTRDEAIAQVVCAHNLIEGDFGSFVDSLVRLGLLKLDEPNDYTADIARFLPEWNAGLAALFATQLRAKGFKIVKA